MPDKVILDHEKSYLVDFWQKLREKITKNENFQNRQNMTIHRLK